jgi:Na+/H+ antiporter NhaD/arsenite permease-like protein
LLHSRQGHSYARSSSIAPLLFGGIALVVLWALVAPKLGAAAPSNLAAAAALITFMLTFAAMSLNLASREATVAVGAVVCLALGISIRFYFPSDALGYLWGRRAPLGFLAGIGMVTGVLHESGWIDRLAQHTLSSSRGSYRRLFLFFCLLTFALSMFINNLATILVVIPLTLRVVASFRIDPVPIVLGEIITSNLGGASTMVGDFPNMLIAAETGMGFSPFMLYLAPICLLQLGLLVYWLLPRAGASTRLAPAQLENISAQLAARPYNQRASQRGLAWLGVLLVAIPCCQWIGVSPALAALIAGHFAMVTCGLPLRSLLAHVHHGDIHFFACRFGHGQAALGAQRLVGGHAVNGDRVVHRGLNTARG